jgi:ketosteroid isomerase-like protein
MKKIIYLFAPFIVGIAVLASCNKGAKTAEAKTDSVAMPYKAMYSSSWAISDSSKNEQMVLQSYKDWEDNKLSNGSAYFADTVAADFSDGTRVKMRRDSFIKYSQKFRDSLSSSKIEMIAITNLHSTDKKEDWVSVWYKQTDTRKTGKIDSTFYNDVNRVKNGKIDYWTSFRQALKKAK